MQFIHSFGLTHTDLKLENVLFATDEKQTVEVNDEGQSISIPNTHHIEGD